jgi:hypothetical protein
MATELVRVGPEAGRVGRWGALALALALAACAETRVSNVMTPPGVTARALSRIAVVYTGASSERTRRAAEDIVVAQVTGAEAVPGYEVLEGIDLRDRAAVRDRLAAHGFDGALIVGVTAVRTRHISAPAEFIPGYEERYGWMFNTEFQPWVVSRQSVFRIEARLYSVRQDRTLWVGSSRTLDPWSPGDGLEKTARAVVKRLNESALLI